MTDQTEAKQEAEVQPEPVPSSEQTQEKSEPVQEAGSKTEAPEPEGKEKPELPEGVRDRTAQQFDKLKDQLRTEREKRMQYEQLLSQPKTTAQQQPGERIYNPETGEVNIDALEGLQARLARTEAELAGTTQRIRETEQQRQEREAFEAHPELNPTNKEFNQDLHKSTRAILLDSMLNPKDYGDEPLSFRAAGDLAKKYAGIDVEKARAEGRKEAVESLSAAEQASLEATGRSDRRQNVQGMSDLRRRSQLGDRDAIVTRLKNIK